MRRLALHSQLPWINKPHSYGPFWSTSKPNIDAFWLWEEARLPREKKKKTSRHVDNIQTPFRKAPAEIWTVTFFSAGQQNKSTAPLLKWSDNMAFNMFHIYIPAVMKTNVLSVIMFNLTTTTKTHRGQNKFR